MSNNEQQTQELSIRGEIVKINPIETFKSGFVKREFVIKTQDEYPQEIKFEVWKKLIDALDQFQENDSVSVSFNIRGREYMGNHYVSLQAWKVVRVDEDSYANGNAETSGDHSTDLDDLDF
jgi:hypothetical protein